MILSCNCAREELWLTVYFSPVASQDSYSWHPDLTPCNTSAIVLIQHRQSWGPQALFQVLATFFFERSWNVNFLFFFPSPVTQFCPSLYRVDALLCCFCCHCFIPLPWWSAWWWCCWWSPMWWSEQWAGCQGPNLHCHHLSVGDKNKHHQPLWAARTEKGAPRPTEQAAIWGQIPSQKQTAGIKRRSDPLCSWLKDSQLHDKDSVGPWRLSTKPQDWKRTDPPPQHLF